MFLRELSLAEYKEGGTLFLKQEKQKNTFHRRHREKKRDDGNQ